MKSRDIGFYLTVLFCLSSILFFAPYRINIVKAYYAYYFSFLMAVIFIFINFNNIGKNLFALPVLLLIIAAFLSAVSATLFWHQSITDSIKAIFFFLSYILFYLLTTIKLNASDIEKIVIIVGILYIVLYLVSFFSFPIPVFGTIWWGDNRGFPRIVLPGVGFLFLLSFYSLNKYLNKKMFSWLIFFSITFIAIIMTLTRQWIAISFVFLALFAVRKSKNFTKIIIITAIVSILLVISQMSFFKLLTDRTISETSSFESNIRVKSAIFYLFHFSPNIFTDIFGNGAPYMSSRYGAYITQLEYGQGLFTSDIGYIGLYTKYGILSILAYLIIIIRTIRVPIPDEYLYCKYFLYYIFVISIMSNSTGDTSFIIPIVLALYILSSQDLSNKKDLRPKDSLV